MSDYIEEEGSDEPTAPFWMTTYGDMVTLLLTFFVLLVSMSTVEVEKFREALSYFTGGTGILQQPGLVPPLAMASAFKSREQAERYEDMLAYLREQGLDDKVQVNLTERGLHVVINDSVMFPSGTAQLIDPSRTVLRMVTGVLGSDVQSVTVEGHTDNRPIHTSMFPSNWELSAARAASVVRFLLEQPDRLSPDRYLAAGYGEFHPVASNTTPEGRARNRRVEILFSWESWQKTTSPLSPVSPKG